MITKRLQDKFEEILRISKIKLPALLSLWLKLYIKIQFVSIRGAKFLARNDISLAYHEILRRAKLPFLSKYKIFILELSPVLPSQYKTYLVCECHRVKRFSDYTRNTEFGKILQVIRLYFRGE